MLTVFFYSDGYKKNLKPNPLYAATLPHKMHTSGHNFLSTQPIFTKVVSIRPYTTTCRNESFNTTYHTITNRFRLFTQYNICIFDALRTYLAYLHALKPRTATTNFL